MIPSHDDILVKDKAMHNFKIETSTCIDLAVAPRVSSFINGIGQRTIVDSWNRTQIQGLRTGLWYHSYAGCTVSRAMQVTKMLYLESSEVSFRIEVNNGMRL
jgi:hypothetical protein